MRPGQNRRVRGRNRNNKGPNPLTRAFESNGPDVKIRGTAQHVADKYAQLARDAQASGDPVSAENYLQHAEHYYRLIAAAQEQLRQQYPGTYGRQFDEDGEEGDDESMPANGFGYPGGDDDGEGYPGQAPVYEGRNGGDNRFSNEGRQAPPEPRPAPPQQQPRYDNNRPNDRGQQRTDRNGERFDRNAQGGGNGYDRNGERYDRAPAAPQGQQAGGQAGYDRQDSRQDQRPEQRPDARQDQRPDARQDARPEQRPDGRQDYRQDGRGGRDKFGGGNRDGRRDYNRNDRPQGDRPQADRPQGDRPQGDRPQGERPQGERSYADRPQGDRPPYGDRQPGRERPAPAPRQDFADEGREEPAAGLPAFLTTPVRAPVSTTPDEAPAESSAATGGYSGETETLPFEDGEAARPRRRRTRRPSPAGGSDEVATTAAPDSPVE